jgi:polyisoprenoid-binding protein YceI
MSTTAIPQTTPTTTTWNIDPAHSVVELKVKHMMIAHVNGHFSKVSGSLTLNESDIDKSSIGPRSMPPLLKLAMPSAMLICEVLTSWM